MATGTTTNLGLSTVEANDQLPEALTKANLETIDNYVAATSMTNKSGSQRVAGEVVVVDTTANSAFTTTSTSGAPKVVGVVQATIAANATGIVKHFGTTSVKVTGATLRGDWLRTSTTPGQAEPVTATDPPNGAFAIALSASAVAGTVSCQLLSPAVVGSIAFPVSTAPSQTSEGLAYWDSDDDRLTVGTGAATKVIGLSRGAGLNASATQELTYDTTAAALKVWDGSASQTVSYVKKVGESLAKVATTSTTVVDLITISGLNIPVTSGVHITGQFSRTGGAGANVGAIGFKVNSTVVSTPSATTGIGFTSATNQAEDGSFVVEIAPRGTDYLSGWNGYFACKASATGAVAVAGQFAVPGTANPIPNAAITSITITGINNTSNVNIAAANIKVYEVL